MTMTSSRQERAFPGQPIGLGQGDDDTGTLTGGGYGLDTSQGGGVVTGGAEGYSSNLNAVGTSTTPDGDGGGSSSSGGGGSNSSVLGPAGSSSLPTSSGVFSSVTADPTTYVIGGLAVVAGVAAIALVVHRHKAETATRRVSRSSGTRRRFTPRRGRRAA